MFKKDIKMHIPHSHLYSWNIHHTRVFVRIDGNVPLDEHGKIISDFRLQKTWPTIAYIINNGGTPIVATHLGRPKNNESTLSTKLLMEWFTNKGCTVVFLPDIQDLSNYPLSSNDQPILYLLENLRFFPGEQTDDLEFARQLAGMADYYVNDAFGVIHRSDTSTTLLPLEFSPEKRTIGFLMEKELSFWSEIKAKPRHPFVMIIGGNKGKEKLELVSKLTSVLDTLIVCPALSDLFTDDTKNPDPAILSMVNTVKNRFSTKGIRLVVPDDYQVNRSGDHVSIGSQTLEKIHSIAASAGTVFFNGMIGFFDDPETMDTLKSIFLALTESSAISIVAGGDSVAAVTLFGLESQFDHLSTGGGAVLAALSDTTPPGLLPFLPHTLVNRT